MNASINRTVMLFLALAALSIASPAAALSVAPVARSASPAATLSPSYDAYGPYYSFGRSYGRH